MKTLNQLKKLLHFADSVTASTQETQLYKTLVESSPQAIYILDKDKYIVDVYNMTKAEKVGLTADHVKVGENLSHYINDKSSAFYHVCNIFNETIDKVWKSGNPITVEYKILDSYLRASVSIINGERILIQVHDITSTMKKLHDLELTNNKELSMALTAGGLTSWSYDVETRMLSSSHNNNIIGSSVSFDNLLEQHILPEYHSLVIDMFDNMIAGRIQNGEVTIMTINIKEEIQWTNVHAMPLVFSTEGKVKIIVGSQKDVSKEYEYNKEINLLNKQNTLILNNIKSALVYITPDFRVIWENVSTIFKHNAHQSYYATGTYCYTSFNRDTPCENCVMQRAMLSGKSESMEIMHESGLSIEVLANPILGEGGGIEGVVLRIDDVTEKKKSNQKLKVAEQRVLSANRMLNTIIDNLPSSFFVKDANDNYLYLMVNKKFSQGLGQLESELVGKTDYDIFPKAEADQYRQDDIETVESNQTKIINGEQVTLKDEIAMWYTVKTPLVNVDDNNQRLLVGIGLDITESHKAYQQLAVAKKKAEESDKLKSAFLANMSHEIRTPLNAIVGFSELMQSSDDPDEKKEYMRIISANNELLLRLINDILDLSKLESGIVQLHNSEFDLVQYFDELSATMRQQITNPNIEFITVNPYESCIVETDKSKMTQVWHNFMTNAIKYTVSGHIKMGYEYINEGIKIYVEDSGIGISDEKKDKLFHRFEKLDSFAQGTGLGLSICKAITELAGGEVGCESTEGKGSLFWSWKPQKAVITNKTDNNSRTVATTPDETGNVDHENYSNDDNPRILVAEDNDSNYLLVKSILRDFDTTRAINGIEAVEKAKDGHYDIILMDMKMPIMNGIEATREIRKFNQEITIIALTANAFDTDKQEAFDAGCNDFITKPISKMQLLEILHSKKTE